MSDKKRTNPLSSFGSLIVGLFAFGSKKNKLSALEEEAIQSPGRVIIKNFFNNRLAIIGLISFGLILSLCFGLSLVFPINLLESEPVVKNLQPGFGLLSIPSELKKEGIKMISSGRSFSVGLSESGKVYTWGNSINKATQISKEATQSKIVQIAAGDDHVIALTSSGTVLGWGYNNFGQAELPFELQGILTMKNVVQIGGNDQYSVALTSDGELHVWGSVLNNKLDIVPVDVQGRIKKFATTSYNMLLLLDDGTVRVTGVAGNEISSIPDALKDGSVKGVDIAISYRNALILDDQGKLHTWGSSVDGMLKLPEINGKVKAIDSGRGNFVAVTEQGDVIAWGRQYLNMTRVPASAKNVDRIFTDYFANYAITKDGKVVTWGQSGYLFGTDELGRDVFTRILHGGKVTLTVGAVSVVISTIIGLIVGLISGFYGGWIDNLLMRFGEIVSSFPFMPLAITLSTLLGAEMNQKQRIALIMVILGSITWPGLSRLIRGQILAEREKDFVLAAKALGIRERVIILRHILPNIINVVIVSMTISYAGSLLTEAGLSYLGFGILPPSPSWGNMLNSAQKSHVIEHFWWLWIVPGIFVFLSALSVNLIGDGLRDAMDPKANEK